MRLSFTFPSDISHTRGPLDGSLYAQVRKRRGPGTTASAASPNGCLTSSPTVKPQSPTQSQPHTYTSSSSSVPSGHLGDVSPSINCPAKENTDFPLGRGNVKDRAKEKERDRETAILDDGDPSSPRGLRREQSCCSQVSPKCSDAGWERNRELCLVNGHCLKYYNNNKKHPKSQTLPALPSKSMSPPPHSTHMELCHRHSAHPLPELPWERPSAPPSLPCLHKPCFPYPIPEHPRTHSHTLPASNRLCAGEECHLFHYSSHGPGSHLPHQGQSSTPYREMLFSSPPSASCCTCQDCSSRQSSSMRAFHLLHPEQSDNPHWSQGAGIQRIREASPVWETENPWELARGADFWQCKSSMSPLRLCHSALDEVPNPEQPRFAITPHQNYPVPQPIMDVRDGASSGYHTPLQPRHSCPCSPYQSSPSESRESQSYASGYHSGSASPLPASSPSPGRGRLPDTPLGTGEQSHTENHKGERGYVWGRVFYFLPRKYYILFYLKCLFLSLLLM